MIHDVVVIGAGLAGLIGGLRLAEAGQRVLLVAKGHGTTHWTAGTIDLIDDEQPRQAIERLRLERPEHPYARAGWPALAAALDRLQQCCKAAGYPLVGSSERNLLLPTAVGALRPTGLCPATMAAGAAQLPGPLLVAGFRELRDFFPPLIAANLCLQGWDARPIYLELPPGDRRLDYQATVLAERFQQPDFRAAIGRQLRDLRGSATRIAMPALLGFERATEVVADLQELAGALIFEVPTLPPSIPGMRLFKILSAALRQAGGQLQLGGWVVDHEAEGTTLKAIYTEAAGRQQRHTAHCFLLATGGVAGGGIRTDHQQRVRETALELPVQLPAGASGWFAERFLAPDGHPVYRAGVAVDEQLRPLDTHGRPAFSNVAVAGAILSGADLIRERSYEGVALASGWRAAGTLLEYLQTSVLPSAANPAPGP